MRQTRSPGAYQQAKHAAAIPDLCCGGGQRRLVMQAEPLIKYILSANKTNRLRPGTPFTGPHQFACASRQPPAASRQPPAAKNTTCICTHREHRN